MGGCEVRGGIFGLRIGKWVEIIGKGSPANMLASSLPLIAMTILPLLFIEGDVLKLVGIVITGPLGLILSVVMTHKLQNKAPSD